MTGGAEAWGGRRGHEAMVYVTPLMLMLNGRG